MKESGFLEKLLDGAEVEWNRLFVIPHDTFVIPRKVAESTRPCDFAQGDNKSVEWKPLGEVAESRNDKLDPATSLRYAQDDRVTTCAQDNNIMGKI